MHLENLKEYYDHILPQTTLAEAIQLHLSNSAIPENRVYKDNGILSEEELAFFNWHDFTEHMILASIIEEYELMYGTNSTKLSLIAQGNTFSEYLLTTISLCSNLYDEESGNQEVLKRIVGSRLGDLFKWRPEIEMDLGKLLADLYPLADQELLFHEFNASFERFKKDTLEQKEKSYLIEAFTRKHKGLGTILKDRLMQSNLVNILPKDFSDLEPERVVIYMQNVMMQPGIDINVRRKMNQFLMNLPVYEFVNAGVISPASFLKAVNI